MPAATSISTGKSSRQEPIVRIRSGFTVKLQPNEGLRAGIQHKLFASHADTRERSLVPVVFPIGLDVDSILAWWRQGACSIDLKGMNPLSV
jgi:hypothetical protein